MLLTEEEEKIEGAKEFLKFVLEPKNYADLLLAEPGLFLPVTEDGDTPAWKDSEVLSKYPEAVNMMVEQSKYGYLFGFTRDKIPAGDRPDLGREPALPGRAEGHRRGRVSRSRRRMGAAGDAVRGELVTQ